MAYHTDRKLFEVKEAPNAGFGAFALENIPAGTVILRENALLFSQISEPKLRKVITELPADARAALDELHMDDPALTGVDASVRRVDLNAFNHPTGGQLIFPEVSRFNHSCYPNAAWMLANKSRSRAATAHIRVTRDIAQGEQILIEYKVDDTVFFSAAARNALYAKYWHFHCGCQVCPGGHMAPASDEVRHRAQKVRRLLRYKAASSYPFHMDRLKPVTRSEQGAEKVVTLALRQWQLVRDENIAMADQRLIHLARDVATAYGHRLKVRRAGLEPQERATDSGLKYLMAKHREWNNLVKEYERHWKSG